jgi:hypothetical protein
LSTARRSKTKRPAPRPSAPPQSTAGAIAKKRSRPPPLPPRRAKKGDEPEIRFEYGPAGRDTLAAIADEVAGLARALASRPDNPSAPDITLSETPAGRDTVTAIAREVAEHAATAVRPKLTTLDYETRPGASRDTREAAPEIEIGAEPDTAVRRRVTTRGYDERPQRPPQPSHETLDAIARALAGPDSGPRPLEGDLEICEMVTFVVRGSDLTSLSSEEGRRQFVSERLMRRLPVSSHDDIVRIDVTPWTVRGTLIARVWCRLA